MLQAVSTETKVVSPQRLIRRFLLRQENVSGTVLPSRTSQHSRSWVSPPAVWGQAEPVWKALWTWLRAGEGPDERRVSALDNARSDFAAALADLEDDEAACDLRRRGHSARSLRELWHLRADLYSMVARLRSQPEADRRLQLVNRHFPTSTQQTTTSSAPRPGRSLDD
jgi:hypothetical protein